jgi:hypothetical protein
MTLVPNKQSERQAGGGRRSRDKGNRAERALVRALQDHGFAAERVPLSGAAGGKFAGDVTVPLMGLDRRVEVKCRPATGGPISFQVSLMDEMDTPIKTRLTATEAALRCGYSARHWRHDGASPPPVRSPLAGDGSLSAGKVHVSVLSDGSGRSAESEIVCAAQIRARGRRRRFYLAVRETFGHPPSDRRAFVPPTMRQDVQEVAPHPNLRLIDRGLADDSERFGPPAGKSEGS